MFAVCIMLLSVYDELLATTWNYTYSFATLEIAYIDMSSKKYM